MSAPQPLTLPLLLSMSMSLTSAAPDDTWLVSVDGSLDKMDNVKFWFNVSLGVLSVLLVSYSLLEMVLMEQDSVEILVSVHSGGSDSLTSTDKVLLKVITEDKDGLVKDGLVKDGLVKDMKDKDGPEDKKVEMVDEKPGSDMMLLI